MKILARMKLFWCRLLLFFCFFCLFMQIFFSFAFPAPPKSNAFAVVFLNPMFPAPPQPTSRIEILRNTIRSTDVTIRYSTAMFSTKHGLLTKSAIIVAEVTDEGKMNDLWIWETRNTTPVRACWTFFSSCFFIFYLRSHNG